MARTLAEVDVKRPVPSGNNKVSYRGREEQRWQWNRPVWIIAPVALVAVGGVAFLVARRFLNQSQSDRRSI